MTTHTRIAGCIFAAAAILAAPAAFAQSPKGGAAKASGAPRWDKEPDGFLGIRFDSPFPGDTPECPKDRYGLRDDKETRTFSAMCYWKSWRSNTFEVHNAPRLAIGYTLEVRTLDGQPGEFLLTTGSAVYGATREILTERYGPPSSTTADTVTTKAGAKFDNEILLWKGVRSQLRLEQRTGDINTSTVRLQTEKMRQAEVDAAASDAKSSASKL